MHPHSAASSAHPAPARHLSAELLRRYIAGDIPPAQQHAIEAHTLECQQCADILEGLSQTDAATTDQALTELHQRLQARVGAGAVGRPMGSMWLQAAAAILVLVIAGTFFWMRPQPRPESASVPAPATTSPTILPKAAEIPAPPVVAQAREEKEIIQPVSRPVDKVKAKVRPTRYVRTMRAKLRNVPTAPVASPRQQVAAANPKPDSAGFAPKAADSGTAARQTTEKAPIASSPDTRKPDSVARPARHIRGRLTDGPTGKALPGVVVQATGTTVRNTTNADGSFDLLVPAGVESLTFMSAGYRDAERILGPDSTLDLAMTPLTSATPGAVVPEGRGRATKMPTIPNIAPMPAGGFAAFNEYVEREIRYPEKDPPGSTYSAKIIVKLRFTVGADGSLQDIKVAEHLTDEHDAEAIRLLKEGPTWYPAVVNGQRIAHKAQVNIIFRFDNR
ncbi:carboxypeptidase regulatory-like domain-containing protein [Hymenobacter sp. BT730]|uniref:carboxypeptidase regulatory-like domain-containing protein n=1 Tax=Hymenobacter sp. BT730 TaxID=3063332 RepID=UPI0026E05684|nr:carboxypeptidase regulatory-like domain-containing protein [Hymenobacter sp. BT730]